jgi:hypothetical protein
MWTSPSGRGVTLGAILWRGASLLSDDPIVAIITGLDGSSRNPKTGPMAQVWILRADIPPMDAIRSGADAAICGDCALRGDGAFNRGCYVSGWLGPNNVWKVFTSDGYPIFNAEEARAAMRGVSVRLSAYGDPAAVPFDVWQNMLTTASSFVAYTHQWKRADPRLRWFAMASVENVEDATLAQSLGWRTFRARHPRDPVVIWNSGQEVVCPASDEAGHRVTCQACQLCRGRSRPARSIVIMAHGKPGNKIAFHRLHEVRHD